mgnify:CR=1 FL=1
MGFVSHAGGCADVEWVMRLASCDGPHSRPAPRSPRPTCLRDERVVQVPRGTVAISVASDAEHAVGGSLARGDEVDVYVADASVADRLTRAEVLDTSVLADGGGDLSWVTLAGGCVGCT